MKSISLQTVAEWVGGRLCGENKEINNVSIDSRTVDASTLFIAIKGDRFDAHDFVKDVEKSGAAAVMCHREVDCGLPVIYVDDTKKAFVELAKNYRKSFDGLKVIGLTGSVGKTTTKEMTYEVVSRKYRAIKTEGNLNNDIGLPKTLLRLENDTQAAVIEMGMSAFGEISLLTKTCLPDIGIITNIGVSHIEHLGSRDGILKAKLEILDGMKKGSPLILNGDNDKLSTVKNDDYKLIFFGIENENADVRAFDIKENGSNTEFFVKAYSKIQKVTIPTVGIHNVYDALAAYTVGLLLELPTEEIAKALENYTPSGMRQRLKEVNGVKIIEDCYNASPDSQRAALNVLSDMNAGRKIAVLGDMLELGDYSETAHREVGKYAAEKKIDVLYAFGEQSKYIAQEAKKGVERVLWFDDKAQLAKTLVQDVKSGDCVLFKASRGMKLEEIIEKLYEGLEK